MSDSSDDECWCVDCTCIDTLTDYMEEDLTIWNGSDIEAKDRQWLWSNGFYPDDINIDPETYTKGTRNDVTDDWVEKPISYLRTTTSSLPLSLRNILDKINPYHDRTNMWDILYGYNKVKHICGKCPDECDSENKDSVAFAKLAKDICNVS